MADFAGGGLDSQIEILFDLSKKEYGNPNQNMKKMFRRLRTSNPPFKLSINKDLISLDRIKSASLIIFPGPRDLFSSDEFHALKAYLSDPNINGSILFLLSEGGEGKSNTNVNYLLEEFGMSVNNDSVIRTAFHVYHHPKEVLVNNGVLCQDLLRCASGAKGGNKGGNGTVGSSDGGHNSILDSALGGMNDITNDISSGISTNIHGHHKSPLEFVYPYGATLSVQSPGIPVLSTGPISYPLNRPICAVTQNKPSTKFNTTGSATGNSHFPNNNMSGPGSSANSNAPGSGSGRLCVLGSVRMWEDDFIDKEQNGKLFDLLVKWLLGEKLQAIANANNINTASTQNNLNSNSNINANINNKLSDIPDLTYRPSANNSKSTHHPGISSSSSDHHQHDHSEMISDYHYIPDTRLLAESLKSCLQEGNQVPKDFTTLFDTRLFKFDTSLIPESIRLYQTLGVEHGALTLIPPEFETPLPSLRAAVFGPIIKEAAGPALDLYDLDDCFAGEKQRLAGLTNKCSDEDLEYYIQEAGDILQISDKIPPENSASAKHILEHVFTSILNFRRLNVALGGSGGGGMGGVMGSSAGQNMYGGGPIEGGGEVFTMP